MSGTVRVNNKKCNTSWHFEVSVILLFITGSSAFLISRSCSEGTMLEQFELRANCDGRIQQQTKQHISYIKSRLRKVSSANMSLCSPPIKSRKPAPEETDKVGSAVILAFRDMWIEVQNSVCVWGGSTEDSVLQHGVWVWQPRNSRWAAIWPTVACGHKDYRDCPRCMGPPTMLQSQMFEICDCRFVCAGQGPSEISTWSCVIPELFLVNLDFSASLGCMKAGFKLLFFGLFNYARMCFSFTFVQTPSLLWRNE